MTTIAKRAGLSISDEDAELKVGLESDERELYIASLETQLVERDLNDLVDTAQGLESVYQHYTKTVGLENMDDNHYQALPNTVSQTLSRLGYGLEDVGLSTTVSQEDSGNFLSKVKKLIQRIWEAVRKAFQIVSDNVKRLFGRAVGNVGKLDRWASSIERKLKRADDDQFTGQFTLQYKGELIYFDLISPKAISDGINANLSATQEVTETLLPKLKDIYVTMGTSVASARNDLDDSDFETLDSKFSKMFEETNAILAATKLEKFDLLAGYQINMQNSSFAIARVNPEGEDMGGVSIQRFPKDLAENSLRNVQALIKILDKKSLTAVREMVDAKDEAIKELDIVIGQLGSDKISDDTAERYVRPWIKNMQRHSLSAFNELIRLDIKACQHGLRAIEESLEA